MKSFSPDTYLLEESPQKIEINPECFRRRDGYLEFWSSSPLKNKTHSHLNNEELIIYQMLLISQNV